MRAWSLLLLWVLTLLLLLSGAAFGEVRMVTLQHRLPEDVAAEVRTLFADPQQVRVAGPALVLEGDPDRLAIAEELIGLLDRPAAEVLVRLRWQTGDGARSFGTEHSGGMSDQARYLGNRRQLVQQTLRIREGESGRLTVGREIPYRKAWQSMVGDVTGYAEETAYRQVSSGFHLSLLKITPEQVLLDIEPWLMHPTRYSDRQPPYIDFQQFRTRIGLPPGQWVELARHFSGAGNLGRDIIRYGSGTTEQEAVLFIRADR